MKTKLGRFFADAAEILCIGESATAAAASEAEARNWRLVVRAVRDFIAMSS